ncbi:MAG: SpoIIE family protein phosphatase [Bacteroidales bacterium]|nr:SpoIIE family protein phosphatase [Bacteroidales bacterium]
MVKIAKLLIISGSLIALFFIISTFIYQKYLLSDFVIIILLIACIILYGTGFGIVWFKSNIEQRKRVANIVLIHAMILLPISFLLKMQHMPYSGILLIIAIFLLSFLYAPLNFIFKYKKWKHYTRSKKDAFLLSLFDFLGIVIVLFAILFKLQHWPAAGALIITGTIMVALSIFAWNQKFKREIVYRKLAEDRVNESLEEIKNQKAEIEEKNEELKQQNEEITTQRDMLSEHNKAINESILYAKRIQTAVLPQQSYVDEILPENFILFKPRDVVSGDFYWVKQINNYIVIAAADCTGHGVPGAIMSMLGMSFINEIVQKREITQTNYALNELRKHIKHALRQTGKKGEADDGMDMALCALDLKTKKLQYAGAYNPLYLIQDGELIEIKADRMPIGFYPNEKPSFTNHEIQLKDGDIFYLFSDGYIDQFGGKHGFKFKTVNFQKLLLKNHQKPMIIQKELLEQELSTWMKGYDQTDDILVMGVRV